MPHNGKKTKNEERKIAIIAFTADGVDEEGLRCNGSKKGLSPFFTISAYVCKNIILYENFEVVYIQSERGHMFHIIPHWVPTWFLLGSYSVPNPHGRY